MTEENGPPKDHLTEEEFVRLYKEAESRGEPTTPILRRYILQTVEGVIERLEAERRVN